MRKHLTVTGFVVDGERTLLLWHPLLQMWVPPGGHIEPDEDPATAVLREVYEETGLRARIIQREEEIGVAYPKQLPAPYTILLENSPEPDGPHQHIDLIYFCRLDGGAPAPQREGIHLTWVERRQLERDEPLAPGEDALAVQVPADVRLLALRAIATASALRG